jgi:hypothetical protein
MEYRQLQTFCMSKTEGKLPLETKLDEQAKSLCQLQQNCLKILLPVIHRGGLYSSFRRKAFIIASHGEISFGNRSKVVILFNL